MLAPNSLPLHSIGAIAAASAVVSIAAPLLFYAFTMPVAPLPPMMVYEGPDSVIRAAVDAAMFVPQVPAALFVVTALIGWLLSRLRLRHYAVYALAGSALAFGASRVAPLLISEVDAIILAPDLSNLNVPVVIAAMLLAGAVNGLIFRYLAQGFTPRGWAQADRAES